MKVNCEDEQHIRQQRNQKGDRLKKTDVFISFSKDAEQDQLSFADCHCDRGVSFKVE